MRSRSCPKCNSSMIQGFIADRTDNARYVSSWVEGAPRKSFWLGVKLGRSPRIEIQTWRCQRCGFLESYAPD